jgi:hypothetical protein
MVSVVDVAANVWCCKPDKHEVMDMHLSARGGQL